MAAAASTQFADDVTVPVPPPVYGHLWLPSCPAAAEPFAVCTLFLFTFRLAAAVGLQPVVWAGHAAPLGRAVPH